MLKPGSESLKRAIEKGGNSFLIENPEILLVDCQTHLMPLVAAVELLPGAPPVPSGLHRPGHLCVAERPGLHQGHAHTHVATKATKAELPGHRPWLNALATMFECLGLDVDPALAIGAGVNWDGDTLKHDGELTDA